MGENHRQKITKIGLLSFSFVKPIRKALLRSYSRVFPGEHSEPAWYRASTGEGFAILARYWHIDDISMSYHRCGSER